MFPNQYRLLGVNEQRMSEIDKKYFVLGKETFTKGVAFEYWAVSVLLQSGYYKTL